MALGDLMVSQFLQSSALLSNHLDEFSIWEDANAVGHRTNSELTVVALFARSPSFPSMSTATEAPKNHAGDCDPSDGDLLGIEREGLDWKRGDGAHMASVNIVPMASRTQGKGAEAVGGADGPMATISVNRNQYILTGIYRQFCTTGLPSDVTVEVGDMSFHLHEESYASTISAKYGDDILLQPSFDADAWLKATGGPKKGRLYGFGSTAKATSILGGPSASYSCMQPGSSFQPSCTRAI